MSYSFDSRASVCYYGVTQKLREKYPLFLWRFLFFFLHVDFLWDNRRLAMNQTRWSSILFAIRLLSAVFIGMASAAYGEQRYGITMIQGGGILVLLGGTFAALLVYEVLKGLLTFFSMHDTR